MPKKIDLTGQRFGRMLVISESAFRNNSGSVYWNCRCDCGKEKRAAARSLKNGDIVSCGCYHKEEASLRTRKNLAGKRFGRWRVMSYSHRNKNRQVYWRCVCRCGTTRAVLGQALSSGASQSCGCLNRERVSKAAYRHGMSGTKEYFVIHAHKRLAKVKKYGGTCSIEDWMFVVSAHDGRCAACGAGVRPRGSKGQMISVDHIRPVISGGTTWPTNLQPLCLSCNTSKHSKDFWLWMHKKHPERCTPEYIAEWHAIRKRIDKWFLRRQQQAA